MQYNVVISEEAQTDIERATQHYFSITPKLGKRFLSELRKVQKHIIKNPNKFQIRYLTTIGL